MFDIGFSEIFLFGVIALIVLGPEKLPQAARSAGQWYAKLRRTVSTIQSEIEAELDLAETRQQMQDELAKIRQTEADMRREMAEMRGNMRDFKNSQEDSPKSSNNIKHEQPTSTQQANSTETYSTENSNQTNQNLPAEFAYAYHSDQKVQANSESELIEANTETTIPPIMTRPWENMWFRLGAYDKARRLPAAPYLPNYNADMLLYANADTTSTSTAHSNAQQAER